MARAAGPRAIEDDVPWLRADVQAGLASLGASTAWEAQRYAADLRLLAASDLDDDTPWPAGPTAALNLVARAARTHQLRHCGWTPLRTPAATFWFTPAGQLVEVPRHQQPPPGIDHDDQQPAALPDTLPDPEQLAATELAQLQPLRQEDSRPWLTGLPQSTAEISWFDKTTNRPSNRRPGAVPGPQGTARAAPAS